jgi:biopolymer transport protein ExbD
MANIDDSSGSKGGSKGKPKKQNLRVDFTPMVDMNMLLITFFMFCTTLSKPQMMNLVMPTKDNNVNVEDRTKADESKTVTLLLAGGDTVYYYFGQPKYDNYESLIVSDYSPDGLRKMLVERNGDVIRQMAELRLEKAQNKINDERFKERSKEIRDAKGGQIVVIKPTNSSTYKNLVDVLDEMQICSISLYAIVPMTDGDSFLIENYLKKGALSEEIAAPAKTNTRSRR